MFGYWIADESYCEESGAKEMMLFIGNPVKTKRMFGKTERIAHLVINEDITNQIIRIKYHPVSSGFAGELAPYKIPAEITFEEECIIPEKINIEIDIHRGTLKMYQDGIIYGLFHKIHDITNLFGDNPADPPGESNNDDSG